MASDQGERQSHRNKPVDTSKTRVIVARVIHLQDKPQHSPIPAPPTGIRAARAPLRLEIPSENKKKLATRTEKPLSGVPGDHTNVNSRILMGDVNFSGLELLLRRLEIKKKREPVDFVQRIHELTQQNGYLLAEVAFLKETQIALKEL